MNAKTVSTVPDLFPYLKGLKAQLLLILLCCAGLNINTLRNEYALDDEMVIGRNMNVQMGFAGIGKIMRTDAYQGFLDFMDAANPLSGGRYRPLSIVTFAIEQQLFSEPLGQQYIDAKKDFLRKQATLPPGPELQDAATKVKDIDAQIRQHTLELASIRHAFQVLYFTLSMLVLFWFLRQYLFPNQQSLALIITLLFIFHPVHTEVVANLKSRDEIFSLLFIVLTCLFVFRYDERRQAKDLLYAGLSCCAALLSKEYAVILPLILFAGIVLFRKRKPAAVIRSSWFILSCVLTAVFVMIRFSVAGTQQKLAARHTDVLNDPYMYATAQQKIASKIAVLNEYLRVLLFPSSLSSDYSYNHFPYLTFGNWQVWLSLVIWLGILALTLWLWKRRHPLAFACIFFLGFFMLVNNMLFPIGATMGERLVYHSSLGLCIALGWLFVKGIEKISLSPQAKTALVAVLLLMILIPSAFKTIARNADWKNDYTLFTRDVVTVPNSALTNGNAGAEYFNKGINTVKDRNGKTHEDSVLVATYADTAMIYLKRAVAIHPKYVNAHINLALCYLYHNQLDSAAEQWKIAALTFGGRNSILAEQARILLNKGKESGSMKNFRQAAVYLRDASVIDNGNAEIWDNLGGAEFMLGNFGAAATAFNNALNINSSLNGSAQGYKVSSHILQLENECRADSLNPGKWRALAQAYEQTHFPALAVQANQKAMMLEGKGK